MKDRCPTAKIIGISLLKDWRLLFKGRNSEAYLTIEPCIGSSTPVAVWMVSPFDEYLLDQYEGFPTLYFKKAMSLSVKNLRSEKFKMLRGFVYIMNDGYPPALPSREYVRICLEGYHAFRFNKNTLRKALYVSQRQMKNNRQ